MQALEMIDDGEVTKSGVIVAPPSWGGSDQGQKPPAPPLPVHIVVPVQRSWEKILV